MENPIRYLAFLDILGFKELIENNSLEDVEELYKKFEPSILYSMAKTNIDFLLYDKKPEGMRVAPIEITNLNSLVISDSLIIWTDDNDPNRFIQLIMTVKHHLHFSMKLGIPLRGSITSGQLSLKFGNHEKSPKQNSFATILGLPLTRAYMLENKADWSGCFIDNSCIEEYKKQVELSLNDNPNCANLDTLIKLDLLNKYLVPMKSGQLQEFYCLNWTNYFLNDRFTEVEVRNSFKAHNKISDNWAVEMKIRNTTDYLKATEKNFEKALKFFKEGKATHNKGLAKKGAVMLN